MQRTWLWILAAWAVGCAAGPAPEPSPAPTSRRHEVRGSGDLGAVGPFVMEVAEVISRGWTGPVDEVVVDRAQRVWISGPAGVAYLASGVWQPVELPAGLLAPGRRGALHASASALSRLGPGGRVERLAALPGRASALVGGPPLLALGERLYRVAAGELAEVPAPGGQVRALVRVGGRVLAATNAGAFERVEGEWRSLGVPAEFGAVLDVAWQRALTERGLAERRGQGWELRALPFAGRRLVLDPRPWAAGRPWVATGEGLVTLAGEGRRPAAEPGERGEGGPRQRWRVRRGRRWLPSDEVRALAFAPGPTWRASSAGLWVGTGEGVARLRGEAGWTLAKKAARYEEQIQRYHRRTEFGFVGGVRLARPGALETAQQHESDNDGLWTALYGAAHCFFYGALELPESRARAREVFRALRFLSQVTQGGSHPAPRGFPARTVLPTSGPDPNERYTLAKDRRRARGDPLWKLLHPRWPRSADGRWWWKADTSADELDGHVFFYAHFYDLVADERERAEVREVVVALADHLLEHELNLVDWDGLPTRWGRFDPRTLNEDPAWVEDRGLHSASVLAYLGLAYHVSGEERFRAAVRRLVSEHGYADNVAQIKAGLPAGEGNQSDDQLATLALYVLLLYEPDPALRARYERAYYRFWTRLEPERNPFFNLAAAGVIRADGRAPRLQPGAGWLRDSVEALRRFPLDLVRWGFRNSDRADVIRLPGEGRARGHLAGGGVLPLDERFVAHWNVDPWRLDHPGDGRYLAEGTSYLLAYAMGLYHGFWGHR